MQEPIVVPLDGSALAETALVPAVSIVKRTASTLHLVRVRATDAGDETASAESYFDELTQRLQFELSPASITTAEVVGPVADALIHYAQSVSARMIVMATRRHEGLEHRILSSVTDEVVRHAHIPVLVSGPETMSVQRSEPWECERMLVTLDGSALASQIVPHTSKLAADLGAHVTLLRVLHKPLETVGWPALPFDREPQTMEEERAATDVLEEDARVFRELGVDVTVRVVHAAVPIVETIAEEADAAQADLIAIATRGHGLAKRFAFGSVAHGLIKRMTSPMLILAPQDDAES